MNCCQRGGVYRCTSWLVADDHGWCSQQMEEEIMETNATNQRLVLLGVSPRSEFLLLLLVRSSGFLGRNRCRINLLLSVRLGLGGGVDETQPAAPGGSTGRCSPSSRAGSRSQTPTCSSHSLGQGCIISGAPGDVNR